MACVIQSRWMDDDDDGWWMMKGWVDWAKLKWRIRNATRVKLYSAEFVCSGWLIITLVSVPEHWTRRTHEGVTVRWLRLSSLIKKYPAKKLNGQKYVDIWIFHLLSAVLEPGCRILWGLKRWNHPFAPQVWNWNHWNFMHLNVQFSVSCREGAVLMVWLTSGTLNHLVSVWKRSCSFFPGAVATNMAGKCLNVSLKTFSGFTLTNARIQRFLLAGAPTISSFFFLQEMLKPCLEQWSLLWQPSCQAVRPTMSSVQYSMLNFCLDQWSLARQPFLLAGAPTISTGNA